MREDAPLSAEEWEALDSLVVRAAESVLVGRRLIGLTGPLGMGVQTVPVSSVEEGCSRGWAVPISPVLAADRGLVVFLEPENLDLAVAQDLITAYLGNEDMDHRYRVMESLVLRIKRPGAICTFEE